MPSAEKQRQQLSFLEHLEELRRRIIYCLIAFVISFLICYMFSEKILSLLAKPLLTALPQGKQNLHITGLIEPFLAYLKVSLIAALFLSFPYIFFQLWQFVAPGLYRREKKLVIFFIALASLFFCGGAIFGYFFVFPLGFKFFISLAGNFMEPIYTVNSYLTLAFRLLLAFALVFELPLVVLFLTISGLVSTKTIARQWRYVILGCAFLAAALTPPDAVTMLLLMLPVIILFFGSLLLAHLFSPRQD